jgi:uncharacterized linocin/CFP29 family protein
VNHLLRSLAPISDTGWNLLDQEARERLQPALAARRLVDFSGPHGWEHSATNLGRTVAVDGAPADGVSGRQRVVLPLVELRANFTLTRDQLRDADRGADDVDLEPLDRAAHQIATAESVAVFHGWGSVITGVAAASPHQAPSLGEDASAYPAVVAGAVEQILGSGVAGPFGMALAPDAFARVTGASDDGYPVLEHLQKIVDGPIVRAPGVTGAILLSLRGGDFLFESGQDLSVGYDSHDAQVVALYLEESFSFRVATPEAAVAITP